MPEITLNTFTYLKGSDRFYVFVPGSTTRNQDTSRSRPFQRVHLLRAPVLPGTQHEPRPERLAANC